MLQISVRSVFDSALEPISSTGLKLDRSPGCEGEAASGSRQEARLADTRCCLTLAQALELLDVERPGKPRAHANLGRVWALERASGALNLGKIRGRKTLPGNQMKSLDGAGNRDVEEPAFLRFVVAGAHAHGLEDVWVLDLRWEAEEMV